MPGGDDFVDLAGEVGADAGQPRQVVAALHQHARLLRQVAQDARSIAVGTDAERIRPLDFQQVGDLVEDRGDVGVMDRHSDTSISSASRGAMDRPSILRTQPAPATGR